MSSNSHSSLTNNRTTIPLIINGDDFGYSTAVNRAIIHAHREGVLTSATWKFTPSWSLSGNVLFDLSREARNLNNLLQASSLPAH